MRQVDPATGMEASHDRDSPDEFGTAMLDKQAARCGRR